MNLDELKEKNRQTFRQEAEDLLQDLDEAFLQLEANPADLDLVNRIFRSMHTLKGSGATVGFKDLADFLHHVEDLFNAVREGKIPVRSELVDVGLKSCDLVRSYLTGKNEQESAQNLQPAAAVIAQVKKLLPSSENSSVPAAAKAQAKPQTEEKVYPCKIFRIRFRPHLNLFFSGTDPVSLLDELRSLGEASVKLSEDHLPNWGEFNPEYCYLAWEIQLVTEGTETAVREVFMFVDGECDLEIGLVPYAEAADIPAKIYFDAETIKSFAVESEEHMQVVESKLLLLESEPGAKGPCDSLFRSLHNLKGVCRLLISESRIPIPNRHPLRWLGTLTHAVEGIVERHRDQSLAFQSNVIQTLLETVDLCKKLLQAFESGSCRLSPNNVLLFKLDIDPVTVGKEPEAEAHAKLDPVQRVFAQALGQTREVLEALEKAARAGQDLRSLQEAAGRVLKTALKAAQKVGDPTLSNLIQQATDILSAPTFSVEKLSGVLPEIWKKAQEKIVVIETPSPEKTPTPPTDSSANQSNSSARSIRVDTDKLDRLMRAVGELLVARNSFPLLAGKAETEHGLRSLGKEIKDAGVQISHIADDLQASIMAIRMMPVKNVFQKFPRMVRDMAKSLGKQVDLILEGEETELDKNVLDQIGDPLVHLVRNAVDHGIEKPELREDNNKAASGRVVLRAFNNGANVIIEIEDDGRGMDAAKLKSKAIEKKLLTEEQANAMTEAQAFELIFLAGFSTAEKVTDVSGRGVGMDVVRSNIRSLHGTVNIQSRLGQGSKLAMVLPTSLLVSKGILVQVKGNEYILPMESVVEMIKLPPERIKQLPSGRVAQIRESVLPIITFDEALGEPEDRSWGKNHAAKEIALAIVRGSRGVLGLIVDAFANQVEVIVKPLTGGLSKLNHYQGATIMGDGRVVLVLNLKSI